MNRGFTLVELSIVLVIIGLLVGGIVVGKDIMRNTAVNNVITEYGKYQQAVMTFRDKFGQLPGDYSAATAQWGQEATAPTCKNVASTTQATCDGDGDGNLKYNGLSNEWYRAWQHLANAGMVQGKFSGVAGASGDQDRAVINGNVPDSDMKGAGWTILYTNSDAATGYFNVDTSLTDVLLENVFAFGAVKTNDYTRDPILSPKEARNLDEKMDNGLPAVGKVMTWNNSFLSTCASSDNSDATYQLSYTSKGCSLIFKTGY